MTEKNTNAIKWIAIGCGGALVVFLAFMAVIFLVVMKATEKPEKVVKEFLQLAGNQEMEAAYDLFSVPLKEAQSFEEFRGLVESKHSLFQVTDTTFSSRNVDLSSASFSGTITIAAGTKIPASFKLVQENDEWKLISYSISNQ